MKQKKREEKKGNQHITAKNVVCMFILLVALMAAAAGGCAYFRLDLYYTARNLIMCMTAGLAILFSYQAGRLSGSFSYDDGDYPARFMWLYLGGLVCALVFINLPVTGWMFLFFYVALARVSDSVTGVCAGTSLLILTTVFCQQISLPSFLVYLFSGMIGIVLFAHQEGDFHIAIPLGLSLGIQLLLIFSGEILIQNKRFVWEAALIPLANTIMNGILLCIFLQYYINKVARKVQNLYLMLNDPEYTAMTDMREKSQEDYYRALHTAYLVERIAGELGLDVMASKCAAYYNHLDEKEREKHPFPQHAEELLAQLGKNKKPLKEKEAVVVLICDEVITMVQKMKKKGGNQNKDYAQRIERLFEYRFTMDAFAETDITLSNLRYIRKRLMEETMYYEHIIK